MSVPKTNSDWLGIHSRANILLFSGGIVYGGFAVVGFFSAFTGGWAASSFAAMLYPLHYVLPASSNSFWPAIVILLYVALPDIIITLLLFRWRARTFALVLGSLTVLSFLGFLGFFVLLAAAFS
jgi:hypothetical protein